MPFYDYECTVHGRFEQIRRIAERHAAECPECGMTCDRLPMSIQQTTTALSENAKAELMDVLQHAVSVGERVPDINTYGQAQEFLHRRGFSLDGVILTTELGRRLNAKPYDHMEVERQRK